MAKKSEERVSMNTAIREKLSQMPDPLHFELPDIHKNLLQLVYAVVVIGAILLVLLFNNVGVLTVKEANASIIVIMILGLFLAMMLIEKATMVHRPGKSSS